MARPKQELMKPKPPVEFTSQRKAAFLENVRETGFMILSAEAAGVDYNTVLSHRKKDTEFDKAVSLALDYHTENTIERALFERGVNGFKKPIVGGKDRDIIVGHETIYSDTCLTTLARSRKGKYNKGAEADGSEGGGTGGAFGGFGGGLLIVPFPPPSKEMWEALYGEAAKGMTGSPEEGA